MTGRTDHVQVGGDEAGQEAKAEKGLSAERVKDRVPTVTGPGTAAEKTSSRVVRSRPALNNLRAPRQWKRELTSRVTRREWSTFRASPPAISPQEG